MKKLIAIILITILMLSLIGCGFNDNKVDESMRLDLTIVKIINEDQNVTFEMKSEDSDEVNYIVYITETTEVDVDVDSLEEGDLLKVYANEIMESYPMQVNALKISQ